VGAEVAEAPVGFAGEDVDRGVDMAAAEIDPGAAHPPLKWKSSQMQLQR